MQFTLWARSVHGLSRNDAARRLCVAPNTLGGWLRGFEANGLAIEARGRPAKRADADQRLALRALFELFGPDVGIPTLSEIFPSLSRRELEDLARNYREDYREGKFRFVDALTWSTAGAVWAMDYTTPPKVMEDGFTAILVVRDLASGNTLLALPAKESSAQTTVDALCALFVEHGPPLVIKSDNGKHFVAQGVEDLLARHVVVHLRSPFHTPRYNGSCEAGIGSLKIRAHFEAARHDRPGEWTLDDVEAARRRGNELGRPSGPGRHSPDDEWNARAPLVEGSRAQLAELIRQNAVEETAARGYQEGAPMSEDVALTVTRAAVARALCQMGFVHYRRRRLPLPVNPGLRTRIA